MRVIQLGELHCEGGKIGPDGASEEAFEDLQSSDSLAIDALLCLWEIAAYGQDGREGGEDWLPFLSSQNGTEKEYGITTMAAIGYTPALPQMVAALPSPDWRVPYAAVRALGWFGDKKALPDVQKVASTHSLPEVREEAAKAVFALQSPEGRLEGTWRIYPLRRGDLPFENNRDVLGDAPACRGRRWRWKGTSLVLRRASDEARDTSLPLPGGTLKGTNHGEWGGTLSW